MAALLPMLPFSQPLPDLGFQDAGLAQQAAAWRARQGQLAATLAAALGAQGGAGGAPPALVQELQRANLESLHALAALHVAQAQWHQAEVERLRAQQLAHVIIPTADSLAAGAPHPAAMACVMPAFPDAQSLTPTAGSGGDAPPATPAGGTRAPFG